MHENAQIFKRKMWGKIFLEKAPGVNRLTTACKTSIQIPCTVLV